MILVSRNSNLLVLIDVKQNISGGHFE